MTGGGERTAMPTDRYSGACHCRAVSFEVELDLTDTVVCNCSLCRMRGFRWSFVPADRFRLLAGEAMLRSYRFHRHEIDHRFCARCGVEPFAFSAPEGRRTAMIDVRCLDGVDADRLPPPASYDGRSR